MTHKLLIDDRKLIVFATIEGDNESREFKFVLDTGASKTVISDSVAIRLGFDLYRLERGNRLMTAGGAVHSKILKLPKFSLFGKDLSDFEVNIIRFPLEMTYYADGIVGMDFLLKFKNIKFDFETKTIET